MSAKYAKTNEWVILIITNKALIIIYSLQSWSFPLAPPTDAKCFITPWFGGKCAYTMKIDSSILKLESGDKTIGHAPSMQVASYMQIFPMELSHAWVLELAYSHMLMSLWSCSQVLHASGDLHVYTITGSTQVHRRGRAQPGRFGYIIMHHHSLDPISQAPTLFSKNLELRLVSSGCWGPKVSAKQWKWKMFKKTWQELVICLNMYVASYKVLHISGEEWEE